MLYVCASHSNNINYIEMTKKNTYSIGGDLDHFDLVLGLAKAFYVSPKIIIKTLDYS